MDNLEKFLTEYKTQLEKNYNPERYSWPITELENVYGKMRKAIIEGTFSKDSDAIKLTCKHLNIKHTYKAIKEFIS